MPPGWPACSRPCTAPPCSSAGGARCARQPCRARRSSGTPASPSSPCRASRQVATPATTRFRKNTEEKPHSEEAASFEWLTLKKIQVHVVRFEPVSEWPRHMRAYPRERGGNNLRSTVVFIFSGLSPRTRGKHDRADHEAGRQGPIPANAGETRGWLRVKIVCGAYPRERGGNRTRLLLDSLLRGLSPRTRGKQYRPGFVSSTPGPIPANAGETATSFATPDSTWAYPRERGGNLTRATL